MKVLFYTKMKEGAGKRLQRVIKGLVSEDNIEIHKSIISLSLSLRQPKNDKTIAVLMAARNKDLMDILSISDLLHDISTIVILPDSEDDSIRKGHHLRPRYLSYIDSDFSDVGAVLGNMLRSFLSRTETADYSDFTDQIRS